MNLLKVYFLDPIRTFASTQVGAAIAQDAIFIMNPNLFGERSIAGAFMNDMSWYVYQQGQQLGPFGVEQVKQMIHTQMIAQDAFLFKVGWKDWRPVEEAIEEMGMHAPPKSALGPQKRVGAPRATIQGRVVVHNNGQLAIGQGVNISSSGIFVETAEQIFNVGEKLKISVRCEGMSKAFNVIAQVIRFNTDNRSAIGYGLKFENLDPNIEREVQRLVNEQNAALNAQKAVK